MTVRDRPLSYWISVARMGFENDFNRLLGELGISRAELAERVGSSPAHVSKLLNGTAGNFQLSTMAKWARAIGAIVQIRLIRDGKEVVRVLDYDAASRLDDLRDSQAPLSAPYANVVFGAFGSPVQEHGLRIGRMSSHRFPTIVTGDYKEASSG